MEANVTYGAWKEDAQGLHKAFRFKNFRETLAFTVEVGQLAEKADHHPDIDIRYNKVALTLMTHSAGKVTQKDHALAAEIDQIPLEEIVAGAGRLFK